MAGLHLVVVATAAAGQLSSNSMHDMLNDVRQLDPRHELITLEASTSQGPCLVELSVGASDQVIADALVAGCGAPAAYVVEVQGDYTHIFASDTADRLLDREITLQSGRRTLEEVAAEVDEQLRLVDTASLVPLSAVSLTSPKGVLVDVAGGTATARAHLRGLRPVSPLPDEPGGLTYEARVLWSVREAPHARGLILRVVDITAYPVGQRGSGPDRVAGLELMLQELEADATAMEDPAHAEYVEQVRSQLQQAREQQAAWQEATE